MPAVEDICMKIKSRLDEIDEEIASLKSALRALEADEAARQPAEATKAATSRARRGRGRGRAVRTVSQNAQRASASAEMERMLAKTGGMSAVELAKQTGTAYEVVLERIRELERAGRMSKS